LHSIDRKRGLLEMRHGNKNHQSTDDNVFPPFDFVEDGPKSQCSLSKIFTEQYRQLVRFCRMRMVSDADAEDIVQSAFLAAQRFYPDKGVEELGPLLMTMVRNRMVDFLKSGHRKRQLASVEIGDIAEQLACGRSPTPEQLVMDQESLKLADALIAGMPARRREALLLHRVEGLIPSRGDHDPCAHWRIPMDLMRSG